MIYRLSVWLTKWFIKNDYLQQEDYETYVYCIDSLLAKIVFYISLSIVALLFNIVPITIGYYVGFITFRYTAGGYHAKTALRCSVLSWSVYAIMMYLIVRLNTAPETMIVIAAMSSMTLALLVAWRHAPIDHFNKPVSTEKKQRLRQYCLGFQSAFMVLTMLLLSQHYYNLAVSLAFGSGVAALFLLIAYHQKGGKENEKDLKSLL